MANVTCGHCGGTGKRRNPAPDVRISPFMFVACGPCAGQGINPTHQPEQEPEVAGMIVPKSLQSTDPYVQKARRRYRAGYLMPDDMSNHAWSMMRRPDNGNAKQS